MATAGDRVDRQFHCDQPNKPWVTDITEHPTRDGKLYCAVGVDAWSRPGGGLVDRLQANTALVTNALGMAIEKRRPQGDTVIHSDQGTHSTSWSFTRRAVESGLLPSMGSVGDCLDKRNDRIEPPRVS